MLIVAQNSMRNPNYCVWRRKDLLICLKMHWNWDRDKKIKLTLVKINADFIFDLDEFLWYRADYTIELLQRKWKIYSKHLNLNHSKRTAMR